MQATSSLVVHNAQVQIHILLSLLEQEVITIYS